MAENIAGSPTNLTVTGYWFSSHFQKNAKTHIGSFLASSNASKHALKAGPDYDPLSMLKDFGVTPPIYVIQNKNNFKSQNKILCFKMKQDLQ